MYGAAVWLDTDNEKVYERAVKLFQKLAPRLPTEEETNVEIRELLDL